MSTLVVNARKKYNINYPNLYAPPGEALQRQAELHTAGAMCMYTSSPAGPPTHLRCTLVLGSKASSAWHRQF